MTYSEQVEVLIREIAKFAISTHRLAPASLMYKFEITRLMESSLGLQVIASKLDSQEYNHIPIPKMDIEDFKHEWTRIEGTLSSLRINLEVEAEAHDARRRHSDNANFSNRGRPPQAGHSVSMFQRIPQDLPEENATTVGYPSTPGSGHVSQGGSTQTNLIVQLPQSQSQSHSEGSSSCSTWSFSPLTTSTSGALQQSHSESSSSCSTLSFSPLTTSTPVRGNVSQAGPVQTNFICTCPNCLKVQLPQNLSQSHSESSSSCSTLSFSPLTTSTSGALPQSHSESSSSCSTFSFSPLTTSISGASSASGQPFSESGYESYDHH